MLKNNIMGEINLRGVTKYFNDKSVLNSINLTILNNSFNIILGENGSGKTTLFKIMIGLVAPDQGEVFFDNMNLRENYKVLLKKVGVVLSDERTLYHKLTAYENLYYIGRIYDIPKKILKVRIGDLLEKVGLANDKKLVEDYSTGMKKKLMIARALINDPDYFFGDEILNGLDEDSKARAISLLNDFYDQGKTIVLITHIIEKFNDKAEVYYLKKSQIYKDNENSND